MLHKLLAAAIQYRIWKPENATRLAREALPTLGEEPRDHETHLRALLEWLCLAQDVRNGRHDWGGISAGHTYEQGWLPSYPETSGYIVETLLAAGAALGRDDLTPRAERVLDWLITLQHDQGGFPERLAEVGTRPVIFNTGQIVHGLIAGHAELGREDCLVSAVRAARWMMESQDEDGCWRRHVHNAIPHTYNTRAAWALARVGLASGNERFVEAARANLEWALTQQTDSGWLGANAFERGGASYTHTIAYAIRGILECAQLLDDDDAMRCALRAANALAEGQREDGWLAGAYDGDGWHTDVSYCCLTGLAQMVLVWQRLERLAPDSVDFGTNVERGIAYLKGQHRLHAPLAWRGALAGSAPIWGGYWRFGFPNWASKFLADALLMDGWGISVPADRHHAS